MLRERLQAALREAGEKGDERAARTLRLVLAALDERERSAHEDGAEEPLDDEAILQLLREMIAQRRQEIERCEASARVEEAEREAEEIEILEHFLPAPMSPREIDEAVEEAIRDLGATSLKDAGRVLSALKARYNGRIDLARAKKLVCGRLQG